MSTITMPMQQQEDSQPLTHRHRSQRKGNDHVGRGTANDVDPTTTTTTTTTTTPTSAAHTSDKRETSPDEHPSKSSPSDSNPNTPTTTNKHPTGQWWKRSLQAAFKGGASGSIAMVLQVILLMWLRTTINYQYKHGVDTRTALRQLYREGGLRRFYRGAWVALLTGPISRFGDTAAQEGIHEVWRTHSSHRRPLPVWAMTLSASLVAALWRVVITPLDTLKTTLQVTGSHEGWKLLGSKTRAHGLGVLWDGALGNSMATLAGHYPWFLVHNFLDTRLPRPRRPSATAAQTRYRKWVLLRRALLGFCSSVASDCLSNGIRVLKTYQQTSPLKLTLAQALADLLQANGPAFVVRGLRLKILANGVSGILFAVVWKLVLEELTARTTTRKSATTNNAAAAADATMAKDPSKEA